MIPQVEGATEGLVLFKMFLVKLRLTSSTLVGIGAQFGPIGVGLAALSSALFASIKIIDAYTGVHLNGIKQ